VVFFVFSGKKRLAHIELVKDAAEGPHINRCSVWDTEYDFRSAVETRLDVGVYLLILEAARAEVDNFDA